MRACKALRAQSCKQQVEALQREIARHDKDNTTLRLSLKERQQTLEHVEAALLEEQEKCRRLDEGLLKELQVWRFPTRGQKVRLLVDGEDLFSHGAELSKMKAGKILHVVAIGSAPVKACGESQAWWHVQEPAVCVTQEENPKHDAVVEWIPVSKIERL